VSVSENDWVRTVRWIAAGDPLAFYALYDRTREIVFTLLLRMTNDPRTAEAITLEVFAHIWREASSCDSLRGSVIGWILDHARRMALNRVQSACPTTNGRHDGPQTVPNAWAQLARNIGLENGFLGNPAWPASVLLKDPDWELAAPGISCRLLATDAESKRVSMMVRLDPGTDYPPHRHAGREDLYLLHGELMIDEKKVCPGDYVHAEPDSVDHRVWSEKGCTCVLMTSTKDVIL
jgi:quercetin dioxygenase-like cupin family protein